MIINNILEYFSIWINLLILPFQNFNLLWRMIPVYLNGLLAGIYFGPSNSAATFGGLTALWSGADWIRGYLMGESYPSQINWIIAVIFCIYGVLALLVGITKKEKFYVFFGRRSILTFFAVSFYPIQAGFVQISNETIIAIFIAAIPIIILIDLVSVFARKHILKLD